MRCFGPTFDEPCCASGINVNCLHQNSTPPLISMDALAEKRAGISLLRLLRIMRSRQCSDPKDRIYGLLGLSSPSFARHTIPQYPLSVAEVYKNAFLLHLEQSQRLEMLEECDLAVRRISGPSWVPDWSTSYFVENICLDYSSGISRACAQYLPPNVLEVAGVSCGTVATLAEPVVSHDEPEPEYYKYIAAIKNWEPADLKTETYVTGESLRDAYISAICFGMTKERAPRLLFPTLGNGALCYCQRPRAREPDRSSSIE